jgi:hypothetical protein
MIKDPTLMVPFTDYKNNVDEAEQAMFEACVKAACWMCGNGVAALLIGADIYVHKPSHEFGRCKAEAIRIAFPERSARLDAPRA